MTTNEEALTKANDVLNEVKAHEDSVCYVTSDDIEWLEQAITALKQETCEDAISRQSTIEAFQMFRGYESNRTNAEWVDRIVTVVKQLPPVTPQQKTGYWIMPQNDDGMSDPICYQVRCSECGFDLDPQTYCEELERVDANGYCPKCGAKMIDPQESEEK